MILKLAKEYVEKFPEETGRVLHDTTHFVRESDGEVMKSLLNELDQNQVRTALDKPCNENGDEGTGCTYTLLECYIVRGNRDLVRILVDKGAKPREGTFHRMIDSVKGKPIRIEDVVKAFNEVVQKAANHRNTEFDKLDEIEPDQELLKSLTHKYKGMNAIEYACYEQNEDMFRVLMNTEGALKFHKKKLYPHMRQDVAFDVTDLTPDTQMEQTSISCLEILLCSSFDPDRELRAARIIDAEPFRALTRTYLDRCQTITSIFTVIHILYMCSFTFFTVCSSKLPSNDTNEVNTTPANESDTEEGARSHKPVLYLLWIIWPVLSTLMAMFNLRALASVGEWKNYKRSELFFTIFIEVGFLVLMLAFLICAMAADISFYYHFVSTLLIVGWLSTLKYVTLFGSVNALVTQLRSYIIKDIVSFAAVFIFVYFGFSFAIRALLLCRIENSTMSLNEILYTTYSTLHGMGELTNYAESDGKGSDITMMLVICLYCAVTAVLVMAMINKPFDDVMVQYTNERLLRVKVHLLKSIMWYISVTRWLRWCPSRLPFKRLEKSGRCYTYPKAEANDLEREEESDFNEIKQMCQDIQKKIEDLQSRSKSGY